MRNFLGLGLLIVALLGAALAYFAAGGAIAFVMMFGPSGETLMLAVLLVVLGSACVIVAIQMLISSRKSLFITGCVLAGPGLLLLVLRYGFAIRI